VPADNGIGATLILCTGAWPDQWERYNEIAFLAHTLAEDFNRPPCSSTSARMHWGGYYPADAQLNRLLSARVYFNTSSRAYLVPMTSRYTLHPAGSFGGCAVTRALAMTIMADTA
jgi:hypothetical protein